MKKMMTKQQAKMKLASFALKQAHARINEKYGCEVVGNRPLDFASFIRFAQTKQARGTLEEMMETYLTSPKGSLRFDKSEQKRKEKIISTAKLLKELGFDDANATEESMAVGDCENSVFEGEKSCLDFEKCRDFNLPIAMYGTNYYLICDYPGVEWAHAVRICSNPKFDDMYSCALLHLDKKVVYCDIYRATDIDECSDLIRIDSRGIFEIINVK